MRLTEIVQVVPRFFLAILAIALFGTSQLVLISVFGFTSWVVLARVVRAEVLSLKEREFVQAARSQGASSLHILLREILPNALPVTIVYLALLLAHVILLEASLGFLGLGDPNTISWGYLAGQAQQFLRVAWWMSVFPGLAITLTVLGLNLLGDSLTDVLGHRR
jgi:peptide/nickel transport system permease protein